MNTDTLDAPLDKPLRIRTVAKLLDCSTQHVYQLVKHGKLKGSRDAAGTLRVLESDLRSFIAGT
jgi:excisionase family DNA binding protein